MLQGTTVFFVKHFQILLDSCSVGIRFGSTHLRKPAFLLFSPLLGYYCYGTHRITKPRDSPAHECVSLFFLHYFIFRPPTPLDQSTSTVVALSFFATKNPSQGLFCKAILIYHATCSTLTRQAMFCVWLGSWGIGRGWRGSRMRWNCTEEGNVQIKVTFRYSCVLEHGICLKG